MQYQLIVKLTMGEEKKIKQKYFAKQWLFFIYILIKVNMIFKSDSLKKSLLKNNSTRRY